MTSLGEYMSLQNLMPTGISVKPLWVDDAHKSNTKFKKWFQEHLPVYENFSQYRIWNHWNNLLWYTGDILDFMEGVKGVTDFTGFKSSQRRTIPFWVNHAADLLDKRSNDLASLKPNFEIMPPTDNITESTRMASRVVRPISTHIRNFNNLDLLFDENERSNVLYGASFIECDWNDKIGDRRPPKTAKEKKEFESGVVKWEGEVQNRQLFPWHILPCPSRSGFNTHTTIQIYEIIHVEEARAKYKKPGIQPSTSKQLFNFASPFGDDILTDEVVIYRVVVPPSEFIPDGAMIYCLRDGTVLEKYIDKYPFSHNSYPWEVHHDIVAHGKVFPYSILNNIKPLQWTYNLLGGMIKKAIFLTAHPKWMVTRGSVNIQSLANAITVVQHKAGQRPELARYDVVGADTTNFRDSIKLEMQKLAGSFGLSNGDIPPNTRSGIQISRLQNIEKMNRSYQMGKRNDFMRRVLLKNASIAGDRYPTTSPEHLVRILGSELADSIDVLKDSKISSQYIITILNGSGFSDDLAGRVEEVGFIRQNLPGVMTPQQEADIIGIRSPKKFYDVTTAALRMAEKENEDFNDSKPVLPPLMEHDHIQHWQTHVIDMQTPQHAMLPDKIRKLKEEHLGLHEMMMLEIAEQPTGMLYKQRLMTLERFPLVFKANADLAAIQAEQQEEKMMNMQNQELEKVQGAVQQGAETMQAANPAETLQ